MVKHVVSLFNIFDSALIVNKLKMCAKYKEFISNFLTLEAKCIIINVRRNESDRSKDPIF